MGANAILFEEEKPAAAGEAGRAREIPDTVRKRFIQIGNNFYFPDGAETFTDYGNRVTTRSGNSVVRAW